jgi:SAM-dependent methyltransferase
VGFSGREDLAFVGGYQHTPNIDAAIYFVRELFPLIRRRLPGVKCHLIGSRVPPQVADLAAADVIVRGFIPDLGAALDQIKLTVVPLRYGAGTKGKIGTSLSHGVPCVSTTLGVEGMDLASERDILIADSPEEFADAVARLYTDAALWSRVSAAGLRFVREHFSFDRGDRIMRGLLSLVGLPAGEPAASTTTARPQAGPGAAAGAGLEIGELRGPEDYEGQRAARPRREAVERSLLSHLGEAPFALPGFCIACRTVWPFRVTPGDAGRDPGGSAMPSWPDQLTCQCGLNARTRAGVHLLLERLGANGDSTIRLLEPNPPLRRWMKTHFPHLDEEPTPAQESLDYTVSLEALALVADYRLALREAARSLRPGGILLFTVPFDGEAAATLGLTPPASHHHSEDASPGGRAEGSPSYRAPSARWRFGWDILKELAEAEFGQTIAYVLWSPLFGYLGQEVFFAATKDGRLLPAAERPPLGLP